MTRSVKTVVVSPVALHHTSEVVVERDSTCALNVEKPLVRGTTSWCMSEPTQERSRISVRNVAKLLVIDPTLWSIGESTPE